jgi:hypothetical protein
VTARDIYAFVKDNMEFLKKEKVFQGDDGALYFRQFQVLLDMDVSKELRDNSEVVVFKDPINDNIWNLCYGIVVNRVDKRIVVSFRGTSNQFDTIDDIQVAGADVPNPLYKETPRQKRQMQIHKGFYSTYQQKQSQCWIS